MQYIGGTCSSLVRSPEFHYSVRDSFIRILIVCAQPFKMKYILICYWVGMKRLMNNGGTCAWKQPYLLEENISPLIYVYSFAMPLSLSYYISWINIYVILCRCFLTNICKRKLINNKFLSHSFSHSKAVVAADNFADTATEDLPVNLLLMCATITLFCFECIYVNDCGYCRL